MSTATLEPPRARRLLTADQISARLRTFRKARGFTQETLADAIGTTQATVSNWENGSEIPGSFIERIAAAFNIDSDALLIEGDVPKPYQRGRPKKKPDDAGE